MLKPRAVCRSRKGINAKQNETYLLKKSNAFIILFSKLNTAHKTHVAQENVRFLP